MCTITKDKPILQTAEEDIIVYKCCFFRNNHFAISLWKEYDYNLNEICKTKLDPFTSTSNIYGEDCEYISGQGFYSYKEKNGFFIRNCIFIIPKGAKYYLCREINHGEYIYHSDQIKYIGKINLFINLILKCYG